ncbi:uncharacterized protein [Nicotiana tomentosiformis]|uniref:uncharacterized protein n=1 Tax=Nicotiana tomentosiformis TaxID=4098 RepID=UPI00388C644D
MKKKIGIDIGYHKAWRAIQKAIACISGTPEENYQILSPYLQMMVHRNLETYTSIKRDQQNRFSYMFIAQAASIASWHYCRPVIAVDATFFKSKYRGALFVAVSKDANNQIFPLYFGVADSKNIWFFWEMRKAIEIRREMIKCVDKKTYNYIMEETPKRWARSWFPRRHYDMLTTKW